MANALKKIQARAKKLRKRYPKKKYSSLLKQAGKEYTSGKLKPRRKAAAKKRKPAKRKAVRRKVGTRRKAAPRKRKAVRRRRAAKPKVIRRRTVVVYRTKKTRRRRSVSGFGKKGKTLLLVAAAGIGAYLLLKKKTPPASTIMQTANPTRNQTAMDIYTYANAASMTAAAIAKLIQTINSSNDAQVQKIYDNVRSGADPYANVAGIGSRPVLVRSMQ